MEPGHPVLIVTNSNFDKKTFASTHEELMEFIEKYKKFRITGGYMFYDTNNVYEFDNDEIFLFNGPYSEEAEAVWRLLWDVRH